MKTLKIIFGVAVVTLLGVIFLNGQGANRNTFGDASNPNFFTSGTNSSSTVGTVAVMVLNSGLTNVAYVGNEGPSTVWCSYSSTSTGVIAGTGRMIAASTTMEITPTAFYPGQVWCLTKSGTSTIDLLYK